MQNMGRSRCKEVSSTNPAAISITSEELYGRLGVIVLQENTFVPCAEPAAPPRPLRAFLLVCRAGAAVLRLPSRNPQKMCDVVSDVLQTSVTLSVIKILILSITAKVVK